MESLGPTEEEPITATTKDRRTFCFLNTLRNIQGKEKPPCSRLILVNSQMPTQPLSDSPSLARHREKIECKSTEVKTGRSFTNYHHRQKRLHLGKINLLLIKIDLGSEKTKPNIKPIPLLSPLPSSV